MSTIRPTSPGGALAQLMTRAARLPPHFSTVLKVMGIVTILGLSAMLCYRAWKSSKNEYKKLPSLDLVQLNEELLKAVTSAWPLTPSSQEIMAEVQAWTPQKIQDVIEGRESASRDYINAAINVRALEASSKKPEDEVIPYVYMGSHGTLEAVDSENPNKYTEILSCFENPPAALLPSTILSTSVQVGTNGTVWANLDPFFFQKIDNARKFQKPLLIHSAEGENLNTAIIIAYLINRLKVSVNYALHYVKSKRLCAELTPGLKIKLEWYSSTITR